MAGRSQIPFIVVDAAGDALKDATVAITNRVGGAAAVVYTSETGGVTLGTGTPQVLSQKDGRIPGWLPEGSYNIVITHASLPGSPWTRPLDVVKGAGVGNLKDALVSAVKVVANAVTTAKLATDSVTTAKLTAANVTEPKIADSAASSRAIAAGAVTAAKLASDSIDDRAIASGAVTTTKIALLAVNTSELIDGAAVAGKYAASAVTVAKIPPLQVKSSHIADDAVVDGKFALAALDHDHFNNDVLPVGTIMSFGFDWDLTPYAWLKCDGSYLDSNVWPELRTVIGYTYGHELDGYAGPAGRAKLPDLRGRVPYGHNPGSAAGAQTLGSTEGYTGALDRRGPKHLHYLNSTASLTGTGSTHEHLFSYVHDIKANGGAQQISTFTGLNIFWGNFAIGMGTTGTHTHTLGGFWGDNNGMADAPSFLTVQYYIKAGRQVPV